MSERERARMYRGRKMYFCSHFESYILPGRCKEERRLGRGDVKTRKICQAGNPVAMSDDEQATLRLVIAERRECLYCPGVIKRSLWPESMTESDLWNRVKKGLRTIEPDKIKLQLTRVENGVSRSMPDVNALWHGFEFWVELKIAHGRQIEFQPGQVQWLEDRWAASGLAFVLVGRTRGDLFLYRGDQAKELDKQGLDLEPELHLGPGPLNESDWRELLDRVTWGGETWVGE